MTTFILALLILTSQPEPLDLKGCIAVALRESGTVQQARARIEIYKARLKQVESVYYPKIQTLFYVAPMFTVRGDATTNIERKFGPGDWGPYTRLEAQFAWPFYSFGRVEAGKDAATHRMNVERARLQATEQSVALEVSRLYFLRLFAQSMVPAITHARDIIDKAIETAEHMHAKGQGVTTVDLAKLQYGKNELARHLRTAERGILVAEAALKHTMGLLPEDPLQFTENKLNPLPEILEARPLVTLLEEAASQRPEWAQLEQGKKAAIAWSLAEKRANFPVLFFGGQLQLGWAPTRDDTTNPYQFDPFNQIFGGVALGFMWGLDPALAKAKSLEADANAVEVDGLKRFADTGIPVQVIKAASDREQHFAAATDSHESVRYTRQWVTFASTAYDSGTADARDVLEGIVAHVQSKRTLYESIRDFNIAEAELAYAVGHDVQENNTKP